MDRVEQGPATDLPDENNDQRAYWMEQLGVLQGEAARFQALAETDDRAASHLQQTNVQIKAVTQRIRNFDEQRSVELAEAEEAQSRGRRQLCYFAALVAVGLVALAVWALTSQ